MGADVEDAFKLRILALSVSELAKVSIVADKEVTVMLVVIETRLATISVSSRTEPSKYVDSDMVSVVQE